MEILKKALVVPNKRKPTSIPKSVVEKRIKDKKTNSEIKQNRKRPDI